MAASAVRAAERDQAQGDRSAQGRGAAKGTLGHPPGPGLGWPGLRPTQAGAVERDPGQIAVGADRVRLPSARHRQRRDHRALRYPRAEGALPAPAARRPDLLQLLDDRTAGRRGPAPAPVTPRRVRDGDYWVISGWKYFSSNAKTASFLIVMVVTNPDVSPYQGMSMFLVPTDTPGVEIVRNVGVSGESEREGSHALIHYNNVRVPSAALLGGEGQAFVIAQTRLGGGRIHHAMRTIGLSRKALDMMCERALSRQTAGSRLSGKQFVQGYIADSYAQLTQFRLFVLYTAWEIDKYNDYKKVRKDIAAVKVVLPAVLHDIAWRAMQVHGALGVTNEMPFMSMIHGAAALGLADGPTEVHKATVAKQVLRDYRPSDDIWPTEWIPRKRDAARAKFAEYLDHEVGNL